MQHAVGFSDAGAGQGRLPNLGETSAVKRAGGAYDKSSAPKYYVEFKGAGHFAWTSLNPRFQQTIDSYSVAFFDRYLKGSSAGLAGIMANPKHEGVSDVRADAKE